MKMIVFLLFITCFKCIIACNLEKNYLSVIIPAYNEELWIERTVKCVTNSCKEARLKDFEVIVVNDDSTDATAAIAQKNGARVINVQNRHIGKNRNQGANEAKFETVLFLDADSFVSGNDIRRGIELLNQGVPLVTNFARYDPKFPLVANLWCNFSNLLIAHLGWHGTAGGGIMFTCKQKFEELGGFDVALFAAEDIDLIKRFKKRAFIHIDGHTSSRRHVKNGFLSGVQDWIFNQNCTAQDTWYKPNYRETAIAKSAMFYPIRCEEQLFRSICPEVIHKEK